MNIYEIDGYWKDEGTEFTNYLVTDFERELCNYEDEDIFFFGLSEEDIKNAIKDADQTPRDFVITAYRKLDTVTIPEADAITFEEYEEKYKPIKRFDDFKEAIEYISNNFTKTMEYRHVWAATHGDGDGHFMCNGRHVCNVLYHEACEIPWGTKDHKANADISIVAEK